MRLLIINYGALPLPPSKGGAVEGLVDAFIKSNEQNGDFKITAVSIFDESAKQMADSYKYAKYKYIKVSKLSRAVHHAVNKYSSHYKGNAYLLKLIKTINFDNYDVVLVENAPEFGLLLRNLVKCKLILHLHNDYLNINTKQASEIIDAYDRIITLSDYIGGRVRAIKPSEKIVTVHNGIDTSKFLCTEEEKKKAKEQLGVPKDTTVIMYCGRIVKEKGVLELTKAFNSLNDENAVLFIVGGSGYGNNAETPYTKAVKLAANKNTVFTGFVKHSDISLFYKAADIGVAPSICHDGFNLTVVEFLTSGSPVIISDMGAMAEITNSKTALMANIKPNFTENLTCQMKKLLNGKKYLQKRQDAVKNGTQYDIKNYCEKLKYYLEV